METIKCKSCGALQELSNQQNSCNFCGSTFNKNSNAENTNEILYKDKNEDGLQLILHEKSIECINNNELFFLVLLSNISSLTSSIFNPQKPKLYLNGFIIILTLLFFVFSSYDALVPHMVNHSGYSHVTGEINWTEKQETNMPAFVFTLIFSAGILIPSYLYRTKRTKGYINHDNNNSHFITFNMKEITPRSIVFGSRSETERIYNIIQKKIEFAKMRKE
jgi:hypothetical protein